MRYTYTLRLLENERKFFGPGVVQLLEEVSARGSLRSAAISMGMAYSKAWSILKHAEEVLGFSLIDSKKGGKNGGGAVVTQEGRAFLERYRKFDDGLRRAADQLFEQMFAAAPALSGEREPASEAAAAEEPSAAE